MDDLIVTADAARKASNTKLTAEEARALRVAAGSGLTSPQERADSAEAFRSGIAKLRAIEKGGGQCR